MLDIKKVKQMLENGEEVRLECVDREGYEKRHCLNKTLFREGLCLEVLEIWDDGVINLKRLIDSPMDGLHLIPPHEFEHFRIAEDKPTFDDVVDSAFKALKDGVVMEIGLNNNVLSIRNNQESERKYVSKSDVMQNGNCKYLEYIDSLYTETFVIESEEDEMKIRQPVKSIILANGEEIINEDRLSLLQDGLCLKAGAAGNIKIPFTLLKGATVTQKRGNK